MTIRIRNLSIFDFILVALICLLSPSISKAQATFNTIERPEFPLEVSELSADGRFAVGYIINEAYLWSVENGTFTALGNIEDYASYNLGLSISSDGSVIVGSAGNGNFLEYQAFIWSLHGGMKGLGFISPAYEASYSQATSVSADGKTVVGEDFSQHGLQAFRWTEQKGLVALGKFPSYAKDVSSDGKKIVGQAKFPGYEFEHGFLWSEDRRIVRLKSFSDSDSKSFSRADAISSDGSIIVGTSYKEHFGLGVATRWDINGEPYLLTSPGEAIDVSSDGSIIIGNSEDGIPGVYFPKIWTDSGMYTVEEYAESLGLNLSRVIISSIIDMSDDGSTFLGEGYTASGKNIYWILSTGNVQPTAYYRLSVNITPITGGDIEFGGTGCFSIPCRRDFPSGSLVILRALPKQGYELKAWQGCQADANNPELCTVLIDSDEEVKATFAPVSTDSLFNAVANLGIRAVIESEEKGEIEALWSKGGEAFTSRGDRVIWGHFYANPDDVSWGSINNPDLFVKIWFDASGRIDVNYFHVSVPNIQVHTAFYSDAFVPDQSGTTDMNRRYIRHFINPSGTSFAEENFEDGFSPALDILSPDPNGYQIINDINIGTQIYTVEAGFLEGDWQFGGSSKTARGDEVVWGHFSADPGTVTWGNPDNPEIFVKIWYDVSGRIDVNYFHVSVPDIGVYSSYLNDVGFDRSGVTILQDRYTRHEFHR